MNARKKFAAVVSCIAGLLAGTAVAVAQELPALAPALIEKYMTGAADVPRKALVIGNTKYAAAPVVTNALNDANRVEQVLTGLGTKVTKVVDADRARMLDEIDAFVASIASGDIAIFFFAGHGVQVSGNNYLVPTDAKNEREGRVGMENVGVHYLLDELMGRKPGLAVIVLDACRTNPFPMLPPGARSIEKPNGLAQMSPPVGALIAFATGPGRIAWSGDEAAGNSLYTRSLATWIPKEGIALEGIFKRVRAQVLQLSSNEQDPWEQTSLLGDFSFVPSKEVLDQHRMDWVRALAIASRDDVAEYLRLNPGSRYAPAARQWLIDNPGPLDGARVFSTAALTGTLRGAQTQSADLNRRGMTNAVTTTSLPVFASAEPEAGLLSVLGPGQNLTLLTGLASPDKWSKVRVPGLGTAGYIQGVAELQRSMRTLRQRIVPVDAGAFPVDGEGRKALTGLLSSLGDKSRLSVVLTPGAPEQDTPARARSVAFSRALAMKQALITEGLRASNIAITLPSASEHTRIGSNVEVSLQTVSHPMKGK